MKSRTKLLGILALLPLASLSLTTADSEEAEREPAPEAIETEGDRTAPRVVQRAGPMMGDLIFDHEEHAVEMEIECDECHHETNAVPLDIRHEAYFHDLWIDCEACHREAGLPDVAPRSCYECHDGERQDIADERLSSKVILHQNCWACHDVETGVEASGSCELCHAGVQEWTGEDS